jgi:flavodoxin
MSQDTNKGKILIAYFSWGGNTREMAKQIQEETGGDLFEIIPVNPYSSNYEECIEQAKKEQQDNVRPALKAKVENMADYDVIFVGYPNWWGSMPMALFTFLEGYDWSNKTIIPFCTHGNGRWGHSLDDLKQLSPKATVLDGFAVYGNSVKSPETKKDISHWLQKTGMTKSK